MENNFILIFLIFVVVILQVITMVLLLVQTQEIIHPIRTFISSLDDLADPAIIKLAQVKIANLVNKYNLDEIIMNTIDELTAVEEVAAV